MAVAVMAVAVTAVAVTADAAAIGAAEGSLVQGMFVASAAVAWAGLVALTCVAHMSAVMARASLMESVSLMARALLTAVFRTRANWVPLARLGATPPGTTGAIAGT